MTRKYRTPDEIEEEYFRDRPEEIAPYLEEIFDEYAQDGSSAALMASLRVIAKVKGVQYVLSNKDDPGFDDVSTLLNMLGYRLVPKPFKSAKV